MKFSFQAKFVHSRFLPLVQQLFAVFKEYNSIHSSVSVCLISVQKSMSCELLSACPYTSVPHFLWGLKGVVNCELTVTQRAQSPRHGFHKRPLQDS